MVIERFVESVFLLKKFTSQI